MRLGVIGNFRKPRAGNHNARGVDEAGVESLDRCGVYRMSDANDRRRERSGALHRGESRVFSARVFASVWACELERRKNRHKKCREQSKENVGHGGILSHLGTLESTCGLPVHPPVLEA